MIELVSPRRGATWSGSGAWASGAFPEPPASRCRHAPDDRAAAPATSRRRRAFPMVLQPRTRDPRSLAFARRDRPRRDLAAGSGHARPRDPHQAPAAWSAATSRAYAAAYRALLRGARARRGERQDDARSRRRAWSLDPELGLVAVGRTAKDAAIASRSTSTPWTSSLRAERARRLAGAAGQRTCSTSSTGTWSRRSCARRASRRSSRARWRWSPARPRASARPASKRSSRAARRWSGWTSTRRSRACSRRPDFLGVPCDVTDRRAIAAGAGRGGRGASAGSTCWC